MGIIEAGCIDEEHASSVQGKVIGELDLGGTRFQVRSNSKVGTTAYIDELQNACQFTRSVGIIEHTEVFPLPVAPMTLWQDLVKATIKQTCHVRNGDGRVGLWLLLGGDPAGLSRAHAVVEGKRTRG